ncbi:enoyl-CoA hydratase [Stratiformator vulcanicus]|uniref:Enoyl-CoA hydratase domain-containing protein 3, mitochondrial n=1 Tax=Stratiformator vulcanicus TaxID=2527980 RepID=A0A517QYA8_9PLAN|nr:enoyl-CoA hydratase [Stratiformator vulcanicus]QDT36622.1 2,3-dehydroadipyl-CoA hydratase [Stratiformator vulcanicus]
MDELLVSSQHGVTTLTLNRPEKRNALSHSLLVEIDEALDRIASDEESRVVVLAANGPAFCAGHDLKEMTGRPEEEYRELFSTCSRVMQKLRSLPQPVIGRVHALATAAGCQLAAACDLVIAADEAWFATPGVKIGLFCSTPMVPLVRSVGPKVAMEMLLTGVPISARRAYEVGLVNRVAPTEELDAIIAEYCTAILASSPLTLAIGKQAFYEQLCLSESEAYGDATDIMVQNALKDDAQEGMTAFLEKRKPEWTGT